MKRLLTLSVISLGLAIAGDAARASDPDPSQIVPAGFGRRPPTNCAPQQVCPAPVTPAPQPGQPGQPPAAGQPAPEAMPQLPSDAAAQASERGAEPSTMFNPNMFGDLIGVNTTQTITVGTVSNTAAGFFRSNTITARVPAAGRGAFKIADNESPRPTDRVFVTYTFYNDVNRSINPAGVPSFDLHRELIGFEKTFLDGNASIGVRLPFVQLGGDQAIEDSQVGDLSIIFKYALLNDRQTGNVISGGLVLTVPTGEETSIPGQSDLHPTLFQPWGGLILNAGGLYFHGFTSIVVPTDSRDVTILFNDYGVGFWAWRGGHDSFLAGIVPTLEGHVNTPLNHRGATNSPVGFPDLFDLTGGANVVFHNGSTLGVGVAVPLTGPRPFDVEAICSLNIRF